MFAQFKKFVWLALMLALTMGLFAPVSVFAADVSQCRYTMIIRISNSGADAYNVTVPVTINTSHFINNYYVTGNMSNAAVFDSNGNSTAFAPAIGTNTTWLIFAPFLAASSNYDYRLYMGGPNMGGNAALFPGNTTGLTTADAASMELGSNFSISQTGFLDTSYAVGKNLTAKTGALVVNVSAANTISASTGHTTNTTQSIIASSYITLGNNVKRVGQQFNVFSNNTTINSVSFLLFKYGFPTGTVHATIRKTSDDSLVGNLGTLDVSLLTTDLVWYNFNTPVSVTATNSCRILLEYYGGNSTNYLLVSNGIAGFPNQYSISYTSSYSSYDSYDLCYSILSNTVITATSVGTGQHAVTLSSDTINGSQLIVDGVSYDKSPFALTAPNTASNWSFAQNRTYTTLERQTVTVNGTVVQDLIPWNNGLVWTDSSGAGNNATTTIRTGGSHTGITAYAVDFNNEVEAIARNWTLTSTGDSPVPGMPSQMYDSLNATFPGHQIFDDVEAAGDLPPGTLWWLVPGLVLLMASMIIHDKTKSPTAQFIVLMVGMIFLSLAHVWALWMIIPFGLMGGACLISNKVVQV